jgi:WD40 repeat protein
VASAADDLRVVVWELATGRAVAALTGHTSSIRALAWSGDGRWLASGSKDATVRLWEAGWWVPYGVLPHGDTVRAVAFSPDGRALYAGTAEDLIHVWDPRSRRSLRVTARHANTVHALAMAPDGSTLVSGAGDQRVGVWSVPALELRAMLEPIRAGERVTAGERAKLYPGPEVLAVAIGPQGRLAASSHRDSAIRLWRLDTLQEVGQIRSPAATSYGLAFSPDGQSLFTGGDDRTVYRWTLGQSPSKANR